MEPGGHLPGVLVPAPLIAWGWCWGVSCRVWRKKKWVQTGEKAQNVKRKSPEQERVYRGESQATVLGHRGNSLACEVTGGVLGPGLPCRELLEQNTKGPGSTWTLGSNGPFLGPLTLGKILNLSAAQLPWVI